MSQLCNFITLMSLHRHALFDASFVSLGSVVSRFQVLHSNVHSYSVGLITSVLLVVDFACILFEHQVSVDLLAEFLL